MSASKINLSTLYLELSRAGENGEFDKALRIANKISAETTDDGKLLQCKAVCHIHLSEFEEALKVLQNLPNECDFEKAYCLYRLNRIQEALDLLNGVLNPSWKVKELLAQVLYRLERYEQSFEAYRELIKNSDDDYEEERETNLAAVVTNLFIEKGTEFKKAPALREHTYELCYNAACILIAQGYYEKAIEKLKIAEELCKKTLEENDVSEEEIESELGIIRVQKAYALQLLGKPESAMKIYNQVLKKKPADNAVVAVASNNIITINKDQNIFDSKKKIKVLSAENLESKLTSHQRQAITLNHCLLLLHTNQIEQCKKQVQQFSASVPSQGAALMQAALCCKEKKIQKAVDVLKEYAASHPEQSNALSITLAQLLLSQGHVSQACDTLRSMGDLSYSLGVLSAMVTLFLSLEDKESAVCLLKEAIARYRNKNPSSSALEVIIRETANLELKNGHPKEAAELLEKLRKSNPGDLKSLAQLIAAYSLFDPLKAKEVSRALPPPTQKALNIDIDGLESASWTMGAKYIRKSGKNEASTGPHMGSSDDGLQKKKRKHKKGKLPKNFDPNIDPDPERWLPKRERSTFKKKRDKRSVAVGKGTQGAIAGTEEATKGTLASPSSMTPNSPNVQAPRQQKVSQKKKKKGRW